MTVCVHVTVNGNYKVRYSVKHGTGETEVKELSGRGRDNPACDYVYPRHDQLPLEVRILGEEPDNGEQQVAQAMGQ